VEELVELVAPDAQDCDAAITIHGDDFELEADRDHTRRLLLNLLLNALQALDAPGAIRVELGRQPGRRHRPGALDRPADRRRARLAAALREPAVAGNGDDRRGARAVSAPGGRVLIVDDGAGHRELLRDLLGGEAARIDLAEGGREALDRIRSDPPDLLLLDVPPPPPPGGGGALPHQRAWLYDAARL